MRNGKLSYNYDKAMTVIGKLKLPVKIMVGVLYISRDVRNCYGTVKNKYFSKLIGY